MNERWLAARLLTHARWHVPVERRECRDHPGRRAHDRCDRCGQPFCAACLVHVRRWRLCAACRASLGREWQLRSLPQRLRRVRGDVVAGLVVLVVLAGTAGLIQHLLGGAGSDAGLAQIALQRPGGAAALVPAAATAAPGALAVALDGLHAVGQYHVSLAVQTGVRGRNFRPGEAVQVLVTWRGSRDGGAVVNRTVGPLAVEADAQGSFLVHADFGQALPPLPNAALAVVATGSAGSRATLSVVLGHE